MARFQIIPGRDRKYAVVDTHPYDKVPPYLAPICFQSDFLDCAIAYRNGRTGTDGRQHLASFHRVEHHDWSRRLCGQSSSLPSGV
jgi:hypothetical protein